jgi:methyl-accepting chemotaxis protein
MPSLAGLRGDRNLQSTLVVAGGAAALSVVVLAALLSWRVSRRYLEADADRRLGDVAQRSATLVALYLRARRSELELLSLAPSIIAAAEAGDAQAGRRRLAMQSIAQLEQAMNRTRSLDVDPSTNAFLRQVTARSDFAELFVTESHGFNVAESGRTSDFVQSDEDWWQRAWRGPFYQGEAAFDSSAGVTSLEMATAVVNRSGRRVGVIKGVFDIGRLADLITARGGSGIDVELVDVKGAPLVGSGGGARRAAAFTVVPADTVTFWAAETEGGAQRIAAARIAGTRWWAVARQDAARAYLAVNAIGRLILASAIVLVAIVLAVFAGLGAWLNRRVTRPVESLARVASAVAQGDLAREVETGRGTVEVAHLGASLSGRVGALRRLVGAIRSAADEAASMAGQISAATQEMASAGQEMANTTQDLSRRAQEQAEVVKAAAADAGRILAIAQRLATTARDVAQRNATLATLAATHKKQLEESGAALERMEGDIEDGAAE